MTDNNKNKEVFEYGIKINPKLDARFSEEGLKLLKKYYSENKGESAQKALAKAANNFSYGDKGLSQRLTDYCSKGWFFFSSPPLSNAVEGHWDETVDYTSKEFWRPENKELRKSAWKGKLPKAMPISCFLTHLADNLESQLKASAEIKKLSVMGGGTSLQSRIRATSDKAPGPIPFIKTVDGDMGYWRQGKNRRGSCAVYMDVDHPDIVEFIKMRTPSGGDANRKILNRSGVHHGVNFTRKFVEALDNNEEYDLVCPHTKEVRERISARYVWELFLETRELTGEPYLWNIDNVNEVLPETQKELELRNHGSNLCVAPETLVLTREGYQPICDLENESLDIWNGFEWSKVDVKKTGENQKLLRVITNSGFELECTPYHKFYIAMRNPTTLNRWVVEKRAHELEVGDKLIKCNFPIIEGSEVLENAYENGLYSAEGFLDGYQQKIYFYGEKRKLKNFVNREIFSNWYIQDSHDREIATSRVLLKKFFVPSGDYTIQSKLKWFAGLCDGDGTVARNGKTQSIQVSSINKDFLLEVQMMLQTLGVSSKVTMAKDEGWRLLPKNDGSCENKEYWTQKCYRLLIGQTGICTLNDLGFNPHRLIITDHKPNRECTQFVKITNVLDEGRFDDTYCFTEHKRGMGIFNGILTGQCSEISLPNNDERTAVCCLSSLNLEMYDEWKDTNIVQDLVTFLDNILQWFIDYSDESLSRAAFSAEKERAIGIGGMGWANFLMKNNIPFESGGFNSASQWNNIIWKNIKNKAVEQSLALGFIRGEPDDMKGTGRRNSHLLAIAPNANSSILCNTSPSIEPLMSNAYTQKIRGSIMLVKNRYLEPILEKYGLNNKQTWNKVVKSDGSVQWIEELSEEEKKVFKTAWEIDQHWLVQHAEDRQNYVCQAQSLNLFFLPGTDRSYINSVHLKALRSPVLKSLYYFRTGSEGVSDNVKEAQRVSLKDWKDEGDNGDGECASCQS